MIAAEITGVVLAASRGFGPEVGTACVFSSAKRLQRLTCCPAAAAGTLPASADPAPDPAATVQRQVTSVPGLHSSEGSCPSAPLALVTDARS